MSAFTVAGITRERPQTSGRSVSALDVPAFVVHMLSRTCFERLASAFYGLRCRVPAVPRLHLLVALPSTRLSFRPSSGHNPPTSTSITPSLSLSMSAPCYTPSGNVLTRTKVAALWPTKGTNPISQVFADACGTKAVSDCDVAVDGTDGSNIMMSGSSPHNQMVYICLFPIVGGTKPTISYSVCTSD